MFVDTECRLYVTLHHTDQWHDDNKYLWYTMYTIYKSNISFFVVVVGAP